MVNLSVIIVNYRSASFAIHAVASVFDQQIESGTGAQGTIEVLVIDNGSPPEDVALLEGLPHSVKLIRNATNLGFAAAVNQGIREAQGNFVCLLNPDAHLLPGALQRLLEHLHRHPDVAASGPRVWWDDERTFLLPLVRLPTPGAIMAQSLAALNYGVGRAICGSWHRRDLALWRSTVPMTIDMLSGVCLMIRSSVLDRIGGLDPAYPLYFEDADWCRRVRMHGYRLAYVPAAEIVHYYNQSAQLVAEQAGMWVVRSRNYYLEKQFGRWPAALCNRVIAVTGRLAGRWDPTPPKRRYVDLGRQEEPPLFSGGNGEPGHEWLFELSYHWTFPFKAGAFKPTPELRIPLPIWKRLQPGRYYTRLMDLAGPRLEKMWSWHKV